MRQREARRERKLIVCTFAFGLPFSPSHSLPLQSPLESMASRWIRPEVINNPPSVCSFVSTNMGRPCIPVSFEKIDFKLHVSLLLWMCIAGVPTHRRSWHSCRHLRHAVGAEHHRQPWSEVGVVFDKNPHYSLCSVSFLWWHCFKIWYRVLKQNRTAGILENFAEGERYAEHGVRKFVRGKSPEIMPSVNKFFAGPKWEDALHRTLWN